MRATTLYTQVYVSGQISLFECICSCAMAAVSTFGHLIAGATAAAAAIAAIAVAAGSVRGPVLFAAVHKVPVRQTSVRWLWIRVGRWNHALLGAARAYCSTAPKQISPFEG